MDTLLRETVNAVVNSRFPEMSIEGRRQIESILIREEFPKGAIALNEGEVAHEIVFKADSWRFESARERYNLLLETHPEIIKRAPLAHIASYLLMTPETLSRVRSGVL